MSRTRRHILALALLLIPVVASAHAHLKRSDPASGSRISTPPQLIRFWFSERPELSMTFISMKDASGKQITLGAPEADREDPLSISVRVSQALQAGRYTVSWRTAASDGHPSHGSFSFVVMTDAVVPGNGPVGLVDARDALRSANASPASSTSPENEDEADPASSITNSLARAFSFLG